MGLIAIKELKEKLYDVSFIVLVVLMTIVTTFSMINGYQHVEQTRNYVKSQELEQRNSLDRTLTFDASTLSLYRTPDTLSIFHSGPEPAIGLSTSIALDMNPDGGASITLSKTAPTRDDILSSKPLLTLFKDFRYSFVIVYIFSLICLLLSFNAISGEREGGTLQLALSNSLSRSGYFFGKLLGGYIIVFILLTIPSLAGLVMLQILFPVTFSITQLLSLGLFFLAAFIYLCFFYTVGLLASTMVSRSFLSFLVALTIWIVAIEIVPGLAATGGSLFSAPVSKHETEYKQQKLRNEMWSGNNYYQKIEALIGKTLTETEFNKLNEDRRKDYEAMRAKIEEQEQQLNQEYLNQKQRYFDMVKKLSRVSPASSLRFIAGNLLNTNLALMQQFPEQALRMEEVYVQYFLDKKKDITDEQIQEQRAQLFETAPDEDGFIRVTRIKETPESFNKDWSDLPTFAIEPDSLETRLDAALLDYTIIILITIISAAIGFVLFLRYDVRG